jgi:lipopolysaccharide biosynthesis regulator YciM
VSPKSVSPEKEKADVGYERQTSGPGSQARYPSVRQMMGFGNVAWEQDDFAAAFQHFSAILQDHPNFADIRNLAGLCLAMMGDPEGVLEQFDKAL